MKKKVLTVDDSRTIRNMLLVTLNNAGFETIQAEDGIEGLEVLENANPDDATAVPVPYSGIQYVSIPEFQGIGTSVGQNISAALAGQMPAADALAASQTMATREMARAGYPK